MSYALDLALGVRGCRRREELSLEESKMEALASFVEEGIPFHRMLNLKVVALESGRAELEIPWQDALIGDPHRPAVHGGVISTLADCTGGVACMTRFEHARARCSTVDLRVDYLRPGAHEALRCEATVVRMGNRVAAVRMDVFCGQEKVATGQGVYNLYRGED